MPQRNRYSFLLSDQTTRVGYSFLYRGSGPIRVKFRNPGPGPKYLEISTGRTSEADAHTEAAKIVLRYYAPTVPQLNRRATWDEALAHLDDTPDLRPDSVRGYRTAVKAVRTILPLVKGPGEITPDHAHQFKRDYLNTRYTRGHASDARRYARTPTSCTTYLRSLRSLWAKHWKPAGFVKSNPWAEVPYPNAPKGRRVRVPAEGNVTALLKWLDGKGWDLPRLFVETKMLAACRTLDLCRVKSADLDGDTLTLTAEATKTRTARPVPLPPALAAKLHAVKGPTWLWERSVEESKAHRPATRTARQSEFNPGTWRWTIQNLFREFNTLRPAAQRVRPHDLRARGITLVAAATGSVDATAEVLGVDPQTARHYMDRARAFDRADLLKRIAGVLIPTAGAEERR